MFLEIDEQSSVLEDLDTLGYNEPQEDVTFVGIGQACPFAHETLAVAQ